MGGDLVRDEHGNLVSRGHLVLRDLPGYPWLPCPICRGTGSCDHTGLERAKAAVSNLYIPTGSPS